MKHFQDILEVKTSYYRLENKLSQNILYSSVGLLKSISDKVQKGKDFDMKTFDFIIKDLQQLKKKVIKV